MQTALILMTILGCDDSATQCHYVEMVDKRWATIQACDASSEDTLKLYGNLPYPVVVAVCQTPEDSGLAELAGQLVAALVQRTVLGVGPAGPEQQMALVEGVEAAAVLGPAAGAHGLDLFAGLALLALLLGGVHGLEPRGCRCRPDSAGSLQLG